MCSLQRAISTCEGKKVDYRYEKKSQFNEVPFTCNCSADRTVTPLTSPMTSPTWSRPCLSTAPPARIRAITNCPSSVFTVNPYRKNDLIKKKLKAVAKLDVRTKGSPGFFLIPTTRTALMSEGIFQSNDEYGSQSTSRNSPVMSDFALFK